LNGRVEVASEKNSCQHPDKRLSTIRHILCPRLKDRQILDASSVKSAGRKSPGLAFQQLCRREWSTAHGRGEFMALLARAIRQPLSDAVVVERIVAAVMEQKLPPGAKLAENSLCEEFDCSRGQIRRILVVLSDRGVVTLHMNRGAFVSSPKADEARDVFEARRAVERTIVLSAAARADREAFDQLRVSVRALRNVLVCCF
jgi:DNA-binding transcriptional regulator YhcF (GntR family)